MKKFLIPFLSLIFLVATATGQNKEEAGAAKTNPNAPEITFNKKVHDYGTIYQNDDGNCTFAFTNTGKEPVVLSNVRSSCGCTVPKWPRQPVLPGESDTIRVTYATKRIGPINKSITVFSNAQNSPVVLRIKGKVLPPPKDAMPMKEPNESTSAAGLK